MLSHRRATLLYEKACKERGYAKSTLQTGKAYLRLFLSHLEKQGIFDLREVKRDDVMHFFESLESSHSPNTRRSVLITIKQLFIILYEQNKIIVLPTTDVKFTSVKSLPKQILSEKDMDVFLSSIHSQDVLGLRDRALFELMYSSALRSNEVSKLLVSDLNLESLQILIRTPKNRQDRLVPITTTAAKWINEYLPSKVDMMRPLFLSSHGGALSGSSINRRFIRWCKLSGVYRRHLSVHSVRHSCARHLLAHGAHLRYVQELLGHKSVESTERYTQENDKNLKRVYKQYHPRENGLYLGVEESYLKEIEILENDMKDSIERRGLLKQL